MLSSIQDASAKTRRDKTIKGGHCMNDKAYLFTIAIWSLTIDLCIFALPIPMIWNLHMPNWRKAQLSVVFGLWLIDIIISVFRIVTVDQFDAEDLTWSGVSTALWSVADPAVAILVSCAPVYQIFFDRISPKRLFTRLRTLTSHPNPHKDLPDPPLLNPKITDRERGNNTPQLVDVELGSFEPDRSSSEGIGSNKGRDIA
ncbi:MAG: hypothetical protein Q9216_001629 [Gyalolechia sp. 2 TL-2023]